MQNQSVMSALKWLLKIILLAAALWLLQYISVFWYKPFSVEDFYERIATRYLLPREAWQTGALATSRAKRLALLFNPGKTTPLREWEIQPAELAADLIILQSYRREQQNTEQLLSTDALEWQMQQLIEADTCLDVVHPFNPFSGIHLLFTERLLLTQTPANAKEIAEYLEMLAGFSTTTAQALKTAFRLDSRCGKQLPCFAAATSKKQLARFLAVKPISNPLYLQFRKQLARIETSRDTKQELDSEALLLLETSVYPAFQAIYNYLDKYECSSSLPPMSAITDTTQYYKVFHRFSNKSIHPQALFRYASRMTDSLEQELSRLLNSTVNSWQKAYIKLNDTYYVQYTQKKTAKAVLASLLQEACYYLDTTTLYLFETIPPVNYQPYRMPVVLEGFVPTGKPHPIEPQILFNPSDSMMIPPIEAMAFAALEIVPGRLMQRQYQRLQNRLPTFRRYWDEPVFTNGWSSYISILLSEEKVFENPAHLSGVLHQQLIRTAVAVADMGMHLYGWSYGQAVAYITSHTALPVAEINEKLHHVLLFPAHSCTYLIGCRQLIRLRQQAQKELGNLFDIRQFHHQVLSAGALPPNLMERVVKSYIASTKHQKK